MKIKIEAYNIKNVQPEGFIDAVVVNRPPFFLGMQETHIETEKPLRLIDDAAYIVRPIQSVYFPKYRIQFIASGVYWIEQLKYASKILIKQDGIPAQIAQVLSFSREHIALDGYKVEMEYYDKKEYNVAQFLRSDFLQDELSFYVYEMTFAEGISIRTKIEPLELYPEPEQTTYTNKDRVILVKSVLKKQKTFTFYLNQEDARNVQSYLHYTTVSVAGLGYQAEPLKPARITEIGGADLFKCEIDFIYEIERKII